VHGRLAILEVLSNVVFGGEIERRRILSVDELAEDRPHGQEGYAVKTRISGSEAAVEVRSQLDEIVRNGAQRMLVSALEDEVERFIERHEGARDELGRRQVVRNGHLPERTVLTGAGPLEIQQPRVRDRRGVGSKDAVKFRSSLLPPYLRRSNNIDELIPWLYLRGVSTGDFQEALQSLVGPAAKNLSATTINRLMKVWEEEYEVWNRRDLSSKEYVYIWADGIHFKVRLTGERQCLLVVIGATRDGTKELLGILDGERESKQSWRELLLDLKARGLAFSPLLAAGDGALGFWGAVEEEFPQTREQRCWVHKTANILNKLPKSVQPKAKPDLQEIWMAETKLNAEKAFDLFVAKYGTKYPKAVGCLEKDREVLLTFYDFPAEHWVHIRTTNPIESTFGTVRHRHRKTKGSGSRAAGLAMVFKLVQAAERKWRRLNAAKHILHLLAGYKYEDGIMQERDAA
jgi:putative transposase